MKLSKESIFWEYEKKNFKSNLVLEIVLILESKGLYLAWSQSQEIQVNPRNSQKNAKCCKIR